MNKSSKIFVAGGSGMVGSAIIRKLVEKGYTNIVSNYHKREPQKLRGVVFHYLDLTDQQKTEEFFERERPHYVFLAAAKVGGILANNTYKAEFIYQNLAISLNIINASYKYGVKKLINLGSSCIYPKYAPQPMKEEYLLTGPLEPTNEAYAIAKITAIKLCRYYNEQYGTNFFSLMPTNMYGPNDNFDLFTSHVFPAFIRKFHLGRCLEEGDWELIRKDLNKNPLGEVNGNSSKDEIINALTKHGIYFQNPVVVEIWGSGKVYREFLHVDDLASACLFLMEEIDASKIRELCNDYFLNIGTGKDITIDEFAQLVKEIVGFKGKIVYDKTKPDGTPRKLLDISRIKTLGWQPSISLKEGIKKTYDWYLSTLQD